MRICFGWKIFLISSLRQPKVFIREFFDMIAVFFSLSVLKKASTRCKK